jgi:hypothetical protein
MTVVQTVKTQFREKSCKYEVAIRSAMNNLISDA